MGRLIDADELLKAMNTWDKFENDPNEGLIHLRTPALQDRYVLYVKYDDIVNCVKGMPLVTPQEPKCKDCKWWKDSDGEYRRGCGAESICRINTDKVYQGEGYCYLFEPQESEEV